MNVQNEVWTHNPFNFTPTIKPSFPLMPKNDIGKIKTHILNKKNAYFFISLFDLIDLVGS